MPAVNEKISYNKRAFLLKRANTYKGGLFNGRIFSKLL